MHGFRSIGATAAALPFLFLSACAPGDTDSALDDAAAAPAAVEGAAVEPVADMAMEEHVVAVDMVGLDGAEAAGTLRLDLSGTQPVLTVSLRNAGTGVLQGHIHGGTCAERTRAITPLQPVTTDDTGSGESTSTVEMSADELANGQHIVVYHEANGAPGASIVCAEIPTHH